MKRFWRAKEAEPRPFVNCCSVSISLSCCSLPAALGLALTAALIWLVARMNRDERRKRALGSSAA